MIENKTDTCRTGLIYDEVVYCKDCGAEISRESKQNTPVECEAGEASKENVVDATCTEAGLTAGKKCETCG